ncbi:MAG: hypothetical protein IJ752_06975 [Alphaproteobacteria bacterium]|nr:hypothetical protein [Alphaproteobacteria bacterium]
MNLKFFLLHGLIKEFHKSKIRRILARTDIGDEAKKLLIADSLNWLKSNDEAYNLVDTLDKLDTIINGREKF